MKITQEIVFTRRKLRQGHYSLNQQRLFSRGNSTFVIGVCTGLLSTNQRLAMLLEHVLLALLSLRSPDNGWRFISPLGCNVSPNFNVKQSKRELSRFIFLTYIKWNDNVTIVSLEMKQLETLLQYLVTCRYLIYSVYTYLHSICQ